MLEAVQTNPPLLKQNVSTSDPEIAHLRLGR